MALQQVVPVVQAVQYTGTNGAEIRGYLHVESHTDDGQLLFIFDGSSDFYINQGDWVVMAPSGSYSDQLQVQALLTDERFQARYQTATP